MKHLLALFMIGAFSLLSACARPAPELKGTAIYGHEVRTIRLCGDSHLYWLHATGEQQKTLMTGSRRLTNDPYQELYLEFTGRMMHDAPGEFAKAYVGTIEVEKIIDVSAVIPDSCSRLKKVP